MEVLIMNQQTADGQYGVIHEVGDMGLGFTQLPNQNEQKSLQEQEYCQNEQRRNQNNW